MPAAYTTLRLVSGGSTLADLVDGTNYALVEGGWSPAVAPHHIAQMAGRGIFEDVIEEIAVDIFGTTAAIALANLTTVVNAISQATRWRNGEEVGPIILQAQPQGSDLAIPLEAVVLGEVEGDGPLALPVTFNDYLMVYEISGVRLRFVRRGLWLGPEEAVTSTTVVNPERLFVNFASSAPIAGPVKLAIAGLNDDTEYVPAFLLVSDEMDFDLFALKQADDIITAGGAWAVVADTGNHAYGGNVMRYDPVTIDPTGTTLNVTLEEYQQYAVYAALRNNTAAVTWQVHLEQIAPYGSAQTRPVTIDDSSLWPQIVYLGTLSAPLREQKLSLVISSTSVAASLDFNYFAFLPISDGARSIALQEATLDVALGGEAFDIVVDPAALTEMEPRVHIQKVAGSAAPLTQPLGWRGDAYTVQLGSGLSARLLGTNAARWVIMDQGASTPINLTLTATRRRGFLTPT